MPNLAMIGLLMVPLGGSRLLSLDARQNNTFAQRKIIFNVVVVTDYHIITTILIL